MTTHRAAGSAPTLGYSLRETTDLMLLEEATLRKGGGAKAIARQHEKGRLSARERVALLVDPPGWEPGEDAGDDPEARVAAAHAREITHFQELGLWAAWGMYEEHGGAPAAGVVTGIGVIHGRRHVIIANDATVKAGAFFPMTCKKIIRAQTVAMMARLPLVYLVDSAGVFLPLQEDVFPDTDDFGRIFRNNAVLSAMGIPQVAAIMGNCVAGGGYLPVLCDTLLMTEGSGLYLAGPALVKAAIGQQVSDEDLGGASMHAAISGTIDFKEKDDPACLRRLRSLLEKHAPVLVPDLGLGSEAANAKKFREAMALIAVHGDLIGAGASCPVVADPPAARDPRNVYEAFTDAAGAQYDVRDVIACVVDARVGGTAPGSGPTKGSGVEPDFDEYKADFGQSLVCGYARIGGTACGIVANQKKTTLSQLGTGQGGGRRVNMPGVIYDDSADKAARFIMDCNQRKIPLVFLHDTTGFMVGRDSEQGGIIRAGAKMVNAMSNSVVPKIVVILGGSYGAGNYAMCGRAFDPFLTLAWPNARCAVMGAAQAAGTLATIEEASRKRKGQTIDDAAHAAILDAVRASYTERQDIRHAAARGWVDRLIQPHRTREELILALDAAVQGWDFSVPFRTGVLQT